MRKTLISIMVFSLLVGLTATPAVARMKAPVVTLDHVEVATYQPFYVMPRIGYKDPKNPGKVGKYGYSSTVGLAYIFKIHNPNWTKIMLDELRFTVAFEGLEVNTPTVYEDMWIPGRTTNYLRVNVTHEAFVMIVNLMVVPANTLKVKEMGTTQGALVKKWWDTVGEFGFPIEVRDGTAIFKKGEKEVLSYFTGKFPK